MLRLVQKPVSLFGLAFFLLIGLPIWWRVHFVHPVAIASTAVEFSNVEKRVILLRAGLDVKSLAAAGVASNVISACVEDLGSYLLSHPTTLSSADTAVAA